VNYELCKATCVTRTMLKSPNGKPQGHLNISRSFNCSECGEELNVAGLLVEEIRPILKLECWEARQAIRELKHQLKMNQKEVMENTEQKAPQIIAPSATPINIDVTITKSDVAGLIVEHQAAEHNAKSNETAARLSALYDQMQAKEEEVAQDIHERLLSQPCARLADVYDQLMSLTQGEVEYASVSPRYGLLDRGCDLLLDRLSGNSGAWSIPVSVYVRFKDADTKSFTIVADMILPPDAKMEDGIKAINALVKERRKVRMDNSTGFCRVRATRQAEAAITRHILEGGDLAALATQYAVAPAPTALINGIND